MSAPALSARVQARVGALELDVELELPTDEGPRVLVVVGPNGAGKSSLLACLLGALPCERGRLQVGERVLFDHERGVSVPLEERRLAWVPQDYALFAHRTVRDNVAFAVRRRRGEGREVDEALHALGLEALAARLPRGLSGGERQRVALARALAARPSALLLDEPLAALDVGSRRAVRAALAETLARLALPTLVVTHDAADARALGGRMLVLEQGRVVQRGTWEELARAPATPFVEELVAGS